METKIAKTVACICKQIQEDQREYTPVLYKVKYVIYSVCFFLEAVPAAYIVLEYCMESCHQCNKFITKYLFDKNSDADGEKHTVWSHEICYSCKRVFCSDCYTNDFHDFNQCLTEELGLVTSYSVNLRKRKI